MFILKVGPGQGKSTFVYYEPSIVGTIKMTVEATQFFSQESADIVMKTLDVIVRYNYS